MMRNSSSSRRRSAKPPPCAGSCSARGARGSRAGCRRCGRARPAQLEVEDRPARAVGRGEGHRQPHVVLGEDPIGLEAAGGPGSRAPAPAGTLRRPLRDPGVPHVDRVEGAAEDPARRGSVRRAGTLPEAPWGSGRPVMRGEEGADVAPRLALPAVEPPGDPGSGGSAVTGGPSGLGRDGGPLDIGPVPAPLPRRRPGSIPPAPGHSPGRVLPLWTRSDAMTAGPRGKLRPAAHDRGPENPRRPRGQLPTDDEVELDRPRAAPSPSRSSPPRRSVRLQLAQRREDRRPLDFDSVRRAWLAPSWATTRPARPRQGLRLGPQEVDLADPASVPVQPQPDEPEPGAAESCARRVR